MDLKVTCGTRAKEFWGISMDLLFDFSAVARSNEAVRVNSFFTLDITANWDVLRYTPASNRLVCIKCKFVY